MHSDLIVSKTKSSLNLAIRILRCLVTCAALMAIPQAHADVIFDNFGPDDGYMADTGWALSAGFPDVANSFTMVSGAGAYRLDSLTLVLTEAIGGVPNVVDVALMSDADGLPGATLETFTLHNAMPPGGPQLYPPLVLPSAAHPVLTEGTRYWVMATVAPYTTSAGVYVSWKWNSTGDTAPFAYRKAEVEQWSMNPGSNPRGVFRVEGTPVPEPATMVLTALGGLALLACQPCQANRRDRGRS